MGIIAPSFEASLPGEEFTIGSSFTGVTRRVVFTLSHHAIEPHTVLLRVGEEEIIFDRDMLLEGMNAPVGTGHIRVSPINANPNLMGFAVRTVNYDGFLVTKKDLVAYFDRIVENYCPRDASHDQEIEEELRNLLS